MGFGSEANLFAENRRLKTEIEQLSDSYAKAIRLLAKNKQEIERLRSIIADAPHGPKCDTQSVYRPWDRTCDCWKSALAGKEE